MIRSIALLAVACVASIASPSAFAGDCSFIQSFGFGSPVVIQSDPAYDRPIVIQSGSHHFHGSPVVVQSFGSFGHVQSLGSPVIIRNFRSRGGVVVIR